MLDNLWMGYGLCATSFAHAHAHIYLKMGNSFLTIRFRAQAGSL